MLELLANPEKKPVLERDEHRHISQIVILIANIEQIKNAPSDQNATNRISPTWCLIRRNISTRGQIFKGTRGRFKSLGRAERVLG